MYYSELNPIIIEEFIPADQVGRVPEGTATHTRRCQHHVPAGGIQEHLATPKSRVPIGSLQAATAG